MWKTKQELINWVKGMRSHKEDLSKRENFNEGIKAAIEELISLGLIKLDKS